MGIFSSLRRDQKEAIVLLQTGTFLEYFDLMIYVHMAVLLNELFFPKADPHTAALLTAFAFCSTYVMRPFGALLFGYMGDTLGRKTTVVLTTMLMALSCIFMANLPTYAQIGIGAAWAITLCRIVQGLASMGEIIGAEIYLTEIIRPPMQYVAVGLTAVSSALGAVGALTVCSAVTLYGLNWRMAFWFGAIIAIVGTVARTRLRETPDFADLRRRVNRAIQEAEENGLQKAAALLQKSNSLHAKKDKVDRKSFVYYFLLECGWPVCFYFSYIHCGGVLKGLGYSAEQIIHQNFVISIVQATVFLLYALSGYRISPFKTLKFRIPIFFLLTLTYPLLLTRFASPLTVLFVQLSCICFSLTHIPAQSILLTHFPVFKRFTAASFVYALSRALTFVFTSFTLVYVVELFDQWGLLLILIPTTIGFTLGVWHFEKLEQLKLSSGDVSKKPFILDEDEEMEKSAAGFGL